MNVVKWKHYEHKWWNGHLETSLELHVLTTHQWLKLLLLLLVVFCIIHFTHNHTHSAFWFRLLNKKTSSFITTGSIYATTMLMWPFLIRAISSNIFHTHWHTNGDFRKCDFNSLWLQHWQVPSQQWAHRSAEVPPLCSCLWSALKPAQSGLGWTAQM